LQKVAKDGRIRAEDRRMARERRDRIAEEYKITYGDIWRLKNETENTEL